MLGACWASPRRSWRICVSAWSSVEVPFLLVGQQPVRVGATGRSPLRWSTAAQATSSVRPWPEHRGIEEFVRRLSAESDGECGLPRQGCGRPGSIWKADGRVYASVVILCVTVKHVGSRFLNDSAIQVPRGMDSEMAPTANRRAISSVEIVQTVLSCSRASNACLARGPSFSG